jgi:RNA polymerase sigma-70 factor (sigma-E family)
LGDVTRLPASEGSIGDVVAVPTATFEAVYAERWQSMVRFAALSTGSVDLAEEIVQDAFAELHRRWDKVSNPPAYLRVAVAHRCTSWVRRQRLERRHRIPLTLERSDSGLVELVDAMRALTPRQRAAVVLRYLDDMPETEIAQILQCRPGTVKSLLSRGLARLEEVL